MISMPMLKRNIKLAAPLAVHGYRDFMMRKSRSDKYWNTQLNAFLNLASEIENAIPPPRNPGKN